MFRTVWRNASSRGTLELSQWWTRHGFSFCDARIRCTDEGEIESTIPSSISFFASSAQSHVDSDRATSSGNSHASLTRYVATIGGKTRGPPASWCICKAAKSIDREPGSPLAYDPPRKPDLTADLHERYAVGNHQDHARSNDIPIWHDQRARDLLKHDPLGGLKNDLNRRGLAAFGLHRGLRLLRREDLHAFMGSRPSDGETASRAN